MKLGLDKRITVAVVEPAGSVRQLIMDVIKSLGFEKTVGFANGEDLLKSLESETVSWIILPAMLEANINSLHILKIITQTPRLKEIKVSMLLQKEQEDYCLPLAFELGLFSWHQKSYSRDSIESDFTDLLSILKIYNFDTLLVSANYIRSFLMEKQYYKSMLALEENLFQIYPGSAKLLIALAEALYLNKQDALATNMLQQIMFLNPKLTPNALRLKVKYTGSDEFGSLGEQNQNLFQIKNCIIIDPDTDILKQVSGFLQTVGIKKIEMFEDGEQAWHWLKDNAEPALIIQEWRVPKISGPALIQRIRSHGFLLCPILVVSSLVKDDEIPLFKECGVDFVLKKPFDRQEFFKSIITLFQQSRQPKEQRSLELKITRLLQSKKFEEAKRLMQQYFQDERISDLDKQQLEAEYEFYYENYSQAKNLILEILQKGKESVHILNMLGKCFLKLKNFKDSLICFEKANKICPHNIERLIQMADANIAMQDFETAKLKLQSAKNIDPSCDAVLEAEARLGIESGSSESSFQAFEEVESSKRIVAYMNNRAVSLAKAGHFENGIELYQRVLKLLPKNQNTLLRTVAYNLSLAYARYGDNVRALETLESISLSDKEDEQIQKKIQVLKKKIKICMKENKKLALLQDETPTVDDDSLVLPVLDQKMIEVLKSVVIQKGDICCYLLFFLIEKLDERSPGLLKDLPRFKERA